MGVAKIVRSTLHHLVFSDCVNIVWMINLIDSEAKDFKNKIVPKFLFQQLKEWGHHFIEMENTVIKRF